LILFVHYQKLISMCLLFLTPILSLFLSPSSNSTTPTDHLKPSLTVVHLIVLSILPSSPNITLHPPTFLPSNFIYLMACQTLKSHRR
jgi:hypothetical protein